MTSLQKSIWSLGEPSNLYHRQSFTTDSKKTIKNNQTIVTVWSEEDSEDGKDDSKKVSSPIWLCIRCCILGSLLAGIALGVILTLWLMSSSNTTTTIQTSPITSSIISTPSTMTETTTTTSVTIAIPTPPCSLTGYATSSLFYTISNPTNTIYNCYAFAWVPNATGFVNLAFQFRNDFDYWYLDDVSVYCNATQMVGNGNFETGSLTPWIRTTPNGACVGSPGGQVGTASPHTNIYSLQDKCKNRADQISQQFTAIAGQTYIVSFWLKSGATGSGILFSITLN